MKNPIEEFLSEKRAFGGQQLGQIGKRVGEGAQLGAAFAMTGAATAGIVSAAGKMYDAITKKRDFDNMIEANPHLQVHLEREPEAFNRMFSSLRTMQPEFTKDPMVAGAFMTDAMETEPQGRGFVAVRARSQFGSGTPQRLGPASEAALSGFNKGLGMDLGGKGGRPASAAAGGEKSLEELLEASRASAY